MTVNMRLVPNPGDGIVQAIADLMGRDQGFAKNCFDLVCVALTVILSLATRARSRRWAWAQCWPCCSWAGPFPW